MSRVFIVIRLVPVLVFAVAVFFSGLALLQFQDSKDSLANLDSDSDITHFFGLVIDSPDDNDGTANDNLFTPLTPPMRSQYSFERIRHFLHSYGYVSIRAPPFIS